MRTSAIRICALLLSAVSLSACSHWNPANPGNPSNTPYAGEPGSVYDSTGPLRPIKPEPAYDAPAAAMPPAAPVSPAATLPPVSQVPGATPR